MTRKKLVAAFEKGIEDSDGTIAACFNPRHAMRVTHNGKTPDFVICFECVQVYVFLGKEHMKTLLTTGSPQAAFDRVLKEAKVPLPKPAKEQPPSRRSVAQGRR